MNIIVQKVWEALTAANPAAAQLYLQRLPESAKHAEDLEYALREQNQFWRVELGSLSIDTVAVRSVLEDSIPLEDWFEGFTQVVLPVVSTEWAVSL